MSDIAGRLSTALADRYKIERRLGEGGMATVDVNIVEEFVRLASRWTNAWVVLAFATTVHPVGADAQNATEAGTSIIPFPFFFYTPETDLAFGATVVGYKTLPGTDRPSSLHDGMIGSDYDFTSYQLDTRQ